MKNFSSYFRLLLPILTLAGSLTAQTTVFTYQGKLTDGATAANGSYDLQFRLFNTPANGTQFGAAVVSEDVQVANGIFTVNLDFGPNVFPAADERWIDIGVRPGASTGAFTPLSPRQFVSSAPYAMRSGNAGFADLAGQANFASDTAAVGGTPAAQIIKEGDARLNDARIPLPGSPSYVQVSPASPQAGNFDMAGTGRVGGTLNVVGNATMSANLSVGGTISGNGSGLTNLNGASIVNGTVTESSLSPGILNPAERNARLLGSLRWDQIRTPQNFPVSNFPVNAAFDGTHIWVTNASGASVTKLRASDGATVATYPLTNPYGIVFDGANMWVTNRSVGAITKLRASDGANLGSFAVGGEPVGAVFDGTNIWVANNTTNNVTRLRASDGANLGTTAVGTNPNSIAFDGSDIWVGCPNSNNVFKLLGSSGLVSLTVNGVQANGLAFDGEYMWASGGTSLSKIRVSDGALQGTFAANGPLGIAFDGSNIWVVNGGGASSVTLYRATDGAVLRTFRVGSFPLGAAFDGANIWVVNQLGNSVTRIGAIFR